MKLIVDPGDAYQLGIPDFDMQLAEISNNAFSFHIIMFCILHRWRLPARCIL